MQSKPSADLFTRAPFVHLEEIQLGFDIFATDSL